MIKEVNRSSLRVEEVAYLVPHQIIDGPHIEPGGQPSLHTLDNGEFGISLLDHLEQMLVFFQEACVFGNIAFRAQGGSLRSIFLFASIG
jgi:hypothetical protein